MLIEMEVAFPSESSAERSKLASSLHEKLRQLPDVKIERVQENLEAQDSGTILTVLLSAPAVLIAVKMIGSWLIRSNQSSVVIKYDGQSIELNNMNSADVAASISALSLKNSRDR